MLENIKLSFEEVNGDATTITTITINKKVRTLDEALDAIRNHYSGPPGPAKPKLVEAPVPPTSPIGVAPTPPPAPPTGGPTPPPAPPVGASSTPPSPPPAPEAPTGGIDRQSLINKINEKFETDPKYKDFMQIINVMKQATAPNEKTAINDFTDEEVQKLADLVL